MTEHERAAFYRDARSGLVYGVLRGVLFALPVLAAYWYASTYHPGWLASLFG